MCMAPTSPAHACCRDPGLLESSIDRFQLDSAAVADAGMQCTIAGSEDQRIRGAAAVIHDHPTVTYEARVPRETKIGNIADSHRHRVGGDTCAVHENYLAHAATFALQP